MKEYVEAFAAGVKERIINPLSLAFLLSWPIWNYKFILVFFSEMKPYVKFQYISDQVYPDTWTAFLHTLLGPVLTSTVYVCIYPFIIYGVMLITNWHGKRLELLRQRSFDETPLSEERARAIRRETYEQLKNADSEVENKREQIRNLKLENTKLEERLSTLESEKGTLEDSFKTLQFRFDRLAEEKSTLEGEVETARIFSRAVDSDNSDLQSKVAALQIHNQELLTTIEKNKEQIQHLNDSYKESIANARTHAFAKGVSQKLEEHQANIKNKDDRIMDLISENKRLKEENSSLGG